MYTVDIEIEYDLKEVNDLREPLVTVIRIDEDGTSQVLRHGYCSTPDWIAKTLKQVDIKARMLELHEDGSTTLIEEKDW